MILKNVHSSKRSCFLFSVILALMLLSGCSSQNQSKILLEHDPDQAQSSDRTIITFFGYKADTINLVAIENALNNYMLQTPDIYVTYEGLKGSAYWNAFELRDRTRHLDDIIMIDHDRMLSLSAEGRLADLSGLSTLDNYIPWTKSQFLNDDGSVFFLPTCISTYNLYINTDLLKERGQVIPTNLAEFTEVCDFFASQGITPIIVNNYASIPSLIIAKSMYPVYGAQDAAHRIQRFNNGQDDLAQQLRPGVEFVDMMLDRGWIDRSEAATTAQTSEDLDLFSKGDRPFMISGGWASVRLDVDFAYGVYPYPILEDGSVMAMSVDTCISINADSEHVTEAMGLVEYLTQPDVMWEYCDSQCSYSPLTDDRIPSDPTIAPSTPYLTNGRIVLRSDYNLDFHLESALRECADQLISGADVQTTMNLLSDLLYPDSEGGNES